MEEWRDIPSWEGFYQASTEGRIRSLDRYTPVFNFNKHYRRLQVGVVLSPGRSQRRGGKPAHLTVVLQKGNKKQPCKVHNLIALTFIGARPKNKYALHKDDNVENNKADNLYYGTNQQNWDDARRNGKTNHPRGERIGSSILTENIVREIRRLSRLGWMQKEIAIKFCVTQQHVSQIVTRYIWKHVS